MYREWCVLHCTNIALRKFGASQFRREKALVTSFLRLLLAKVSVYDLGPLTQSPSPILPALRDTTRPSKRTQRHPHNPTRKLIVPARKLIRPETSFHAVYCPVPAPLSKGV